MDTTDTDILDHSDMTRLAGGDDLALNRLMDRHAASVLRFLNQMVRNPDDAQELAQETFARVYRARTKFRHDARFTPWLFTIAANLARNHLRWKSRHPALSLELESGAPGQTIGDTLPALGNNPQQAAASAEKISAVQQAIATLPTRMREAILLCTWEDLPVTDAARALSTTPKAIESLLYRARHLLRERLQQWL